MTQILGIVNVTRDSFSDGGQFLDRSAALRHARQLVADGAAIIDVGAESSHPDAEQVPAATEIERLAPVVAELVAAGVTVSVDTYRTEVIAAALQWGASWINDITGLADPRSQELVAGSAARAIVMYSTSSAAHAVRSDLPAEGMVERVRDALGRRADELCQAGVAAEQIVLDPGMGFFLSSKPAASFAVLAGLPELQALGYPLCLCTSRKSFLGALLERPVDQRGPATLASEVFAALAGVEYLRTHEVRPLNDALRVLAAIRQAP